MELFLFNSIPRRDVKPIAKQLLTVFGNLGEVCAAPVHRLTEVKGIGDIDHAHACHCPTCRGQNGGGAFHGIQYKGGADITGETVTWYASSEYGERGFCSKCGSTIAWRLQGNPSVSTLSLGLFENGAGIKIGTHIFSDMAGDYYHLGTDIPHKTSEQMFAEFAAQAGDSHD